jgi:hypothetical protein
MLLAIQKLFFKQVMVILLRIKKPIYFKKQKNFLRRTKEELPFIFYSSFGQYRKICFSKIYFEWTGASELQICNWRIYVKTFETLNKMDIVEDKKSTSAISGNN